MPEVVPGTSIQQMWHVLNFHEQRFTQITQYLQVMEQKIKVLEGNTQPNQTINETVTMSIGEQ
jgi:hypothetical protein